MHNTRQILSIELFENYKLKKNLRDFASQITDNVVILFFVGVKRVD